MDLWKPTRRELIASTSGLVAATAVPNRVWATPGPSKLRFIVIGDWGRRGHAYQRHVAKAMKWVADNIGAAFIVTTGDNFYNWGVSDKADSHWQESWVGIYGQLVTKQWFPVLGNHDYTGNPVAQLGGYKGTGWSMRGTSYVVRGREFGWPDVDLFLIDTTMWTGGNRLPQGFVSIKPPAEATAALKRWLPDALSNSSARIKLAFGHHPIFSVGPHGGKERITDLEKVLKDGGVSAWINGHDHCLYHIRDAELDYVCSGGGSRESGKYTGGRAVDELGGCVLTEQCPDGVHIATGSPKWQRYIDRAGFALFEVSDSRAAFRFFDRDMRDVYQSDIPIRLPKKQRDV